MSGPPLLLGLRRAARRRVKLDTAAVGLPLVVVAGIAGGETGGLSVMAVVVVFGLGLLAWATVTRTRRIHQAWLIARLDARVAGFEDSTALLFQPSPVSGLGVLQRARLERRIAEAERIDLRPPWSRRAIIGAWGLAIVAVMLVLLWPAATPSAKGPASAAESAAAGPPRLTHARMRIIPPAYTGLPAREQSAMDARVPEGSRVEWTFEFSPRPGTARLALPNGPAISLTRDGRGWRGSRTVERSLLYRLEAPGLVQQRLHRLDAIADAPPVVRVLSPNTQLMMVSPGQRRWTPVFEAADDHGVEAVATLRVTVTKGEGENITFEQRARTVRGQGPARQRRFAVVLDLAREGLAPGGDMIVQLVVSDNRAGGRQVVEGPSVILRWPSRQTLADGLDGMLQPTMPAYFRSQRQIIIDAEALIARRRRIGDAEFLTRSNALGIDQAQLRLRYGQFMGEEAEGGGIALPTNDAPAAGPPLPTSDAPSPGAHHAEDGHDHGQAGAPDAAQGGLGAGVDVLREFGHAHDQGDAATLFDTATRSTLQLVLDAMWGSERALRQGSPEDALPFANRALELLKELQQSSRIYLARTGSNLPPIDLTRRLTGKRDGIASVTPVGPLAPRADTTLLEAWRALEARPGASAPRLDALDRWVGANGARLRDPLALAAAIDTVRNEPNCIDCRQRLRGLLWSAIDPPTPAVRRREASGPRGQRYLDGLR